MGQDLLGPHASHILIAEFDVDEGNVLRHQYPRPTGTDEHLLAELMLPDGVHARSEDWTIFMLSTNGAKARPRVKVSPGMADEEGLLYSISMVRTKHDDTVRRGALVKAMAIVTPHHWLQVYKPLLTLALDDYLLNPGIQILSNVYHAINSMVSAQVNLSLDQKIILRNTNRADLFESLPTPTRRSNGSDPHERRSDSSSRLKRRDSRFLDREIRYPLRITGKDVVVPIKIPLGSMPEEIGDYSLISFLKIFSDATHVNGPTHPDLHCGVSPKDVHPLIILFNAIITNKRVLFTGVGHAAQEVSNCVLAAAAFASGCGLVLEGFLARLWPYTNLSSIDDLIQIPGYIAGTTNPSYEAHPAWWDLLCNVSTGQITISREISFGAAKITNGKSKFNDAKSKEVGTDEGIQSPDAAFIEDILGSVQAHYGEMQIRARVREYVARFVRLCAAFEQDGIGETGSGTKPLSFKSKPYFEGDNMSRPELGQGLYHSSPTARRRELQINSARIQAFVESSCAAARRRRFSEFLGTRKVKSLTPPFRPVDTDYQLFRLRKGVNVPSSEVQSIFELFAGNVQTSDQITELSAHLSSYPGGPSSLIVGLFHPSATIKELAMHVFNAFSKHDIASRLIDSKTMNTFHKLAMARTTAAFRRIPVPSQAQAVERNSGYRSNFRHQSLGSSDTGSASRDDHDEIGSLDAKQMEYRQINQNHKLDSFGSHLGSFSIQDPTWT